MRPWPETLTVSVTREAPVADTVAAVPVFESVTRDDGVTASVSEPSATAAVEEASEPPMTDTVAAHASRIDFAIGWVLMPSARAAMRRSSAFSTPDAGRTSDTWKFPSVRVPVLSDTTVWRCESSSR